MRGALAGGVPGGEDDAEDPRAPGGGQAGVVYEAFLEAGVEIRLRVIDDQAAVVTGDGQAAGGHGTGFTGRDQVHHDSFGGLIYLPGILDEDRAVAGTTAVQAYRPAARAAPA